MTLRIVVEFSTGLLEGHSHPATFATIMQCGKGICLEICFLKSKCMAMAWISHNMKCPHTNERRQ